LLLLAAAPACRRSLDCIASGLAIGAAMLLLSLSRTHGAAGFPLPRCPAARPARSCPLLSQRRRAAASGKAAAVAFEAGFLPRYPPSSEEHGFNSDWRSGGLPSGLERSGLERNGLEHNGLERSGLAVLEHLSAAGLPQRTEHSSFGGRYI